MTEPPPSEPAPGDPGRPPGEQPPGTVPGWGGAPPGGGYPAPRQTSSRATTVLVLGIVSLVTFFVLCGLGFIPAIITLAMAPAARREIEASGGALEGTSQVRTGTVLAWVTLAMTAVVVIVLVAGLALLVTGSRSGGSGPEPVPSVSQVTPG